MNFDPDPMQETHEPLVAGEPEYREYSSAPPPRSPGYPATPPFPPRYPPMANMPVPPMLVPPYPYGPARQAPQAPTPQSKSSPPAAKAGSLGWIMLLGSIALAILALGGTLIYAFAQLPHSNTAISSGTNPSQPGVVKVGQSLTVNGLTATLFSVEPLTGDGRINPDTGNKFMVVHIQLQNGQSTSQVYNSFDFHVFNSDNQERDVELIAPKTYTAGQQLSEDDLASNDTITGDLIIQVPVNDHHMKLGWNPSNVAPLDSTYEWDLGL